MNNEQIMQMLKKLQTYCYICGKSTAGVCGTPRIQIGGCCYGYMLDDTQWLMSRYAHIHCFTIIKKKPKGMMSEAMTIRKLVEIYNKDKKTELHILKEEPCCKGKFRTETQNNIRRINRRLNWLKVLQDRRRGYIR